MEFADDEFDDLYDVDGPGYFYVEDGYEVAVCYNAGSCIQN
jgi:hypothetical protein